MQRTPGQDGRNERKLSERGPLLTITTRSDRTKGIVLLLHGGRVDSRDSVRRGNLTVARMRMFAPAILAAAGNAGVAVAVLRNRYRGWNGPAADPVADALWALDEIRRRCGSVPVVIVGHSMGGRAALRVAGEPTVRGVAALAPWLPADEPIAQLSGRAVLIAHGDLDSVTSADASLAYVRRIAGVADRVCFWRVPGGHHAMLEHPVHWHGLVRDFVLGVLEIRPLTQDLADAFDAGALELGLWSRPSRRHQNLAPGYRGAIIEDPARSKART
jgi:pimeloyl-ACP methyl ester carboxylesterase